MRMTREQFERARELYKEIQKYADLIGRIRVGISFKKSRKRVETGKSQST